MFTLKGRQDAFRVRIPKDFLPEHIIEKYTKILIEKRSFITNPIDFLNETVQKVDVLGFNNATVIQQQPGHGIGIKGSTRFQQDEFAFSSTDFTYRAATNPLSLIDKTINITFRHTLGYLNYFMIFESFFYYYSREVEGKNLPKQLFIDLLDGKGSVYCKIVINNPLIDGIDMLSFDYSQPTAQSQTFQVVLKYSNFDYQFISGESSNRNGEVE